MRILVVEDDPFISTMIQRGLANQHYAVDLANNGEEGLDLAFSNDYDMIILDVVLPKKDGLTVCAELRKDGITTPILVLTSLSEEDSVIKGLDSGADDYLTKPFHLGVLLARVRSLTRRQSTQKSAELQVRDLTLNTATRAVSRAGATVDLTAKELMLLEYLMRNPGRVLSREMISEHVWDMNFDPHSNVIDSLVRRLRKKIRDPRENPLVQTIRGLGYKIVADD